MSGAKKLFKVVLIIILIIGVIIGARLILLVRAMSQAADSSDKSKVTVKIEKGSTTRGIAEQLDEEGLISSLPAFRLKSRLDHAEYKAGTYELSPSMTMEEIEKILVEGKSNENTLEVTIPEGYNLKQIAARLEDKGLCDEEDFLDETKNGKFDYSFMNDMPEDEHRLEGFLYPDTYQFFEDEEVHQIIDKMLARFDEVYKKVKKGADQDILSDYSQLELVTVASLVEREAKLDKERPDVASVVYNRLDKNMKLQFCSTVQYALGKVKTRLYNSDLKIQSPYNTYLYEGLPPGPIASPGQASLKAAMNPSDTDYLYFVVSSKGDGSHNFAATGNDFSAYREDYLSSLADN